MNPAVDKQAGCGSSLGVGRGAAKEMVGEACATRELDFLLLPSAHATDEPNSGYFVIWAGFLGALVIILASWIAAWAEQ